ncbi:MAG: glycosyltransferase family 4 protein [Eubacteriales bacterium]|nr:glycosyltransferase family 4 protein [Eubacteriales bacterium]
MMNSVGIIGPFPPPYGGISVHVKRMQQRLLESGYKCRVYDENEIGSYAGFLPRMPFMKEKLLHFHCVNERVRALIGLFRIAGKKIVLTIHGESIIEQLSRRGTRRAMLIRGLKLINHIICVNDRIADVIMRQGVDRSKISVIPAYLHPDYDQKDYMKLPKKVREFIQNPDYRKCGLLIAANGWIRLTTEAGNPSDLYGICSLIELDKRLSEASYTNVKLIIVLLGIGSLTDREKAYYSLLMKQAEALLEKGNLMVFEPTNTELYPIIEKCGIFIRPTLTDGDSVSIREAMHFGKPVIASDAVKRPEGVLLCKTGDIEDLYMRTADVIENYESYRNKAENNPQKDYSDEVISVYSRLLNKKIRSGV